MANKHKKEIINRKRSTLLLIGAGVVALAFLVGGWAFSVWGLGNDSSLQTITSKSSTPQFSFRHPLTGTLIDSKTELPQVYGAMIDNHQDAWPQAGVDKAFLVYEAPVEGGITRLLAFFSDDQTVDKIGPIRSARPYYLDWNNEFDALYAHVGGSNAALQRIASDGTLDLNQYWNDASFWRAPTRFAPHNVYTSMDRLAKAFISQKQARNLPTPLYETWTFKNVQTDPSEESQKIVLSFGNFEYEVKWNFDKQTHRYTRLHNGVTHVMDDGSQIFADNIAVMITDISVIDAIGRRKVRTIGQGKALVFQDGNKIEGMWKKPSESERTKFFDLSDKEIAFQPGTTWIEVISDASLCTTESSKERQ